MGKLFSRFFFASRNKRGLFSYVIAKMIAIGLHTHGFGKLMGCVKVKHYISYSFKIKNSHLPLKVDMERFDFVIFREENSYLKSTILNSNL
ncbi:hypothetical protein [Streptococcus suis]